MSESDDKDGTGRKAGLKPVPLTLTEYVMLVSGALSSDFMAELIGAAERSGEWSPGGIGKNSVVKPDVRQSDIIHLTGPGGWKTPYRKRLFSVIESCYQVYREKFPRLLLSRAFDLHLLRYPTGGFYIEHVDSDTHHTRSLGFSFLLNDDFEGGEMSFFDERLVLKMKPGEVVMFPSSFMFPHGIRPVISGQRYAVVAWLA